MFKRTFFHGSLLLQEAFEIYQRTGHHRSLSLAILASRRLPLTIKARCTPLLPRAGLLKGAFVIGTLLLARLAMADPAPDLTDARVTVPYAELKNLWTAAQAAHQPVKKESKPPVTATLVAAHYQLALNGAQASGTAEFTAQEFTEDWTLIPLLSTETQIESIEPVGAALITHDGFYTLATNQPGTQKIKIVFAVRIDSATEGSSLRLPMAPASINTLTVTGVPPGQALQIAGATEDPAQKNTFRLAPEDHFELATVPEQSIAAPVPSRWSVEPQLFVEFTEGKLVFRERLAANANSGSGLSMDLEMPAEGTVTAITGDDLFGWQSTAGEKAARIVHLRWKTRDLLRRQVEIDYELPQPLTAAEWKLGSPRVLNGETSPPLYVIALPAGLELTPASPAPVPRQLPEWLAAKAALTHSLVVAGEPSLQAKWLPLVQTTRAVVESAHGAMQIVNDGAELTEVEYTIRHEAALGWKISLPVGSELLSCSVDGQAASPINRGENAIEFTLPAERQVDLVKLTYTAKGEPFKAVSGKIAIALPGTELLTNRLDWELRIPATYEVAAFEGNVESTGNSGQTEGNARVIRLHREIYKDERPGAELYYRKPQAND